MHDYYMQKLFGFQFFIENQLLGVILLLISLLTYSVWVFLYGKTHTECKFSKLLKKLGRKTMNGSALLLLSGSFGCFIFMIGDFSFSDYKDNLLSLLSIFF